MDDKLVLTSSGLLTFLNEIEELKDLDLEIVENKNSIDVTIGTNHYVLEVLPESVVEVDSEAIDDIESIDQEGFTELAEDDDIELTEVQGDNVAVEGGIIKELLKTLAVGGLVRLTKDALTN